MDNGSLRIIAQKCFAMLPIMQPHRMRTELHRSSLFRASACFVFYAPKIGSAALLAGDRKAGRTEDRKRAGTTKKRRPDRQLPQPIVLYCKLSMKDKRRLGHCVLIISGLRETPTSLPADWHQRFYPRATGIWRWTCF